MDNSPPRTGEFVRRARMLLTRLVERGLHLPEPRKPAVKEDLPPGAPADAVRPTVTLARIYATQGHKAQALAMLHAILEEEPTHPQARSLWTQLQGELQPPPVAPPPPAPTQHNPCPVPEPSFHSCSCLALPVDSTRMFVSWHIPAATLAHFANRFSTGQLTLALTVYIPTWDGPSRQLRTLFIQGPTGEGFVTQLPRKHVLRCAVGWSTHTNFLPLAISPHLLQQPIRDLLSPSGLQTWPPPGEPLPTEQPPHLADVQLHLQSALCLPSEKQPVLLAFSAAGTTR